MFENEMVAAPISYSQTTVAEGTSGPWTGKFFDIFSIIYTTFSVNLQVILGNEHDESKMTEIKVTQKTPEWMELRQGVQLTASKFGEALGVGKGRPYDFFLSLLSDEPKEEVNFVETVCTFEVLVISTVR